jgi:hypothetical protein
MWKRGLAQQIVATGTVLLCLLHGAAADVVLWDPENAEPLDPPSKQAATSTTDPMATWDLFTTLLDPLRLSGQLDSLAEAVGDAGAPSPELYSTINNDTSLLVPDSVLSGGSSASQEGGTRTPLRRVQQSKASNSDARRPAPSARASTGNTPSTVHRFLSESDAELIAEALPIAFALSVCGLAVVAIILIAQRRREVAGWVPRPVQIRVARLGIVLSAALFWITSMWLLWGVQQPVGRHTTVYGIAEYLAVFRNRAPKPVVGVDLDWGGLIVSVVLTAFLTAFLIYSARHLLEKLRPRVKCWHCGYPVDFDRRSIAVCPECGNPPFLADRSWLARLLT